MGLDETAKRPALPGMYYIPPAPVGKQDPRELTDFTGLLTRPGADLLASRLMDMLGGLSPLVCREGVFHSPA